MQVRELEQIKGSLAKLVTANVPARAAYRAAKFTRVIAKEIQSLEDARVQLILKYGKPNGDGTSTVLSQNLEKFREEFEQLLNEEIEVPAITLEVSDLENAGLTMLDFANLDFMISESEKKE
jgi:hypothetical protein